MTLHIAFQGGTHGHYLRYFLDRFSKDTPAINEYPFTGTGTSHSNKIIYSNKFSRYHPTEEGVKNLHDNHCVITVSKKDLLLLQRTVYIRPADINLDISKDYLKMSGFPKTFKDPESIKNLYGLEVNETTEIPKFILRDFLKLGFSDLDNHGYIIKNKELLSYKFENVYYFPVNSFWYEKLFFYHIKNLNNQFNLNLDLGKDASKLHRKFIEQIPQLQTIDRCEKIISALENNEVMEIPNIDVIEEAYIYSWIETKNKNILAPFTNFFFKNTRDIIEYIKWYPHFYHGMNPTLPKKLS